MRHMFPQTLAISGNSREAAIDPIYVRPLRPDDRPALERWFATVSMASRYARFLGFVTELSPQMWRYLTEIDRHDHVAFVAFYDGRLAGVGRWIREDPDTAEIGPVRIIATRAQFPTGPAKRPDLEDVIFAGGLIRHWDGTATLFAGLSDAEAGAIRIADPMAAL